VYLLFGVNFGSAAAVNHICFKSSFVKNVVNQLKNIKVVTSYLFFRKVSATSETVLTYVILKSRIVIVIIINYLRNKFISCLLKHCIVS